MELTLFNLFLMSTLILADELNELKNSTENTEENTECDKSLYSKQDILFMIEFMSNSLSIHEKLNETLQREALSMRNKHIQSIQTSMEWFVDRPEHLKHILEDISKTRQYVEENVFDVRKGLEKYPDLVTLYQEKVEKTKKILTKFVHYKQLCELNCADQEVEFRRAVTGTTSDQYCATISELHNTIKEQLESFANEYSEHLHQQIIKADQEYDEKVQTRINDLKDRALKEFGHTMYDILNLQDQYHHIVNDLREFNPDVWMVVLRELNIEIDSLLLRLENVVDVFTRYCKTCNNSNLRRQSIEDRQQVDENEKENFFDSLINIKFMQIYNNTEAELLNIFQELDTKLDKLNLDSLLLSNIQPIQEEVAEMTEKEINAFNELRVSNLKVDMDLVKKLIANTKDLIDSILKRYRAILAIVKDLAPK